MSNGLVTVSSTQTVEAPGEGARMAKVVNGTLYIWPAGVGVGPMIGMTKETWARLQKEVRLAYMDSDRLAEYVACEGNGVGEDE